LLRRTHSLSKSAASLKIKLQKVKEKSTGGQPARPTGDLAFKTLLAFLAVATATLVLGLLASRRELNRPSSTNHTPALATNMMSESVSSPANR